MLEGRDAADARAAVERIARGLPRVGDPSRWTRAALFWAYRAVSNGHEADTTEAIRGFEATVRKLADGIASFEAAGSLAAPAWLYEHLSELLPAWSEHDNLDVDLALLSYLEDGPDISTAINAETARRLVGLGLYALERLPGTVAIGCLELVIERLLEATSTARIPGAVVLVAWACRAGLGYRPAELWLEEAVHRAAERPGPGMAAALAEAAQGLGNVSPPDSPRGDNAAWQKAALQVARRAAARDTAETVSHAAAHGHFFNRVYQITGDEESAAAARTCFRRVLDLMASRDHGSDHADTKPMDPPSRGGFADLVDGSLGVGLALMAATTTEAPHWDRALLVR